MNQQKKKVLILTTFEGHVSIAKAIEEAISQAMDVTVVKYAKREVATYLPFYQLFPSLFKIPYKIAEYPIPLQFVRSYIKRFHAKDLKNILRKENPDIIIGTHFMFNDICLDWQKEHKTLYIPVIANPRSLHPIEFCTHAYMNLVYDDEAIETAVTMGIPRKKLYPIGWFVQKKFRPVVDKKVLRKKLHLDENLLTFLVCGGSEGTTMILKILPFLLQAKTHIQVVIICGRNRLLYRTVKSVEKTLEATRQARHIQFHTHGYTVNLQEYIQAADCVVGKAGPNLLFESSACQVPFFAITHISGQEDGNLDLIRQAKLGIVEENPMKTAQILKKIAQHPEILLEFQKPIQHAADTNAQAGPKLLKLLE